MTDLAPVRSQLSSAAIRRRAITRWTGPGWLWLLLLGIIVVASLIAEPFLSSRNLTNVLRQMIPLGIVAVGQTLVILLAGVDLAVAATISMANTAVMGIVAGQAANVPGAIGIVLAIGLFIGLMNGLIIVATRVPALIVTLGTASIVTGITFLYTDQSNFGEPADVMNDIGFGSFGPIPILFLLYVVVAAVGLVVQNKTHSAPICSQSVGRNRSPAPPGSASPGSMSPLMWLAAFSPPWPVSPCRCAWVQASRFPALVSTGTRSQP